MNDKVSIVLPTRNEEKYIKDCLDSFMNQTYPKDLFEVIIADGKSTDKTVEIINEYQEKYNNIRLLDNPGLTAPTGVNLCIKNSKAAIIILFGAHAYADKDFVKKNVEALNKGDFGCVGGPIITISEDDKGKAIATAMSSPFGVGNALFRYAKKETLVDTVAFGAYWKHVLDKIGYLDEELVRNQDDELNLRVTKNGYKILLSPEIKSTYYSRSSIKQLWKQYYQYGFWKVRVMQKHGKTASIRHLVPMSFVLANIFGLVLGLFFKWILMLWIAEVSLYAICDIIFSIKSSKKNIKLLKYIPIIFPILHISYGVGFLEGIFKFYIIKSNKGIEKHTKMSR